MIQKRKINKKYKKRDQSEVNRIKEQDKVWRSSKEELKQRNREAAARYRNKKQRQLQELKQEVEDWKRKCGYLEKNMGFLLGKSELACKTNDILPLTGMTTSEEQPTPEETSKGKVINKQKSKYRNRYEPGTQMSKEQEKKWIEEQRRQRNKEAAAKSYIKKQEQLEELKNEMEHWKGIHDSLMKRKDMLENGSALTSNKATNEPLASSSSRNTNNIVLSPFLTEQQQILQNYNMVSNTAAMQQEYLNRNLLLWYHYKRIRNEEYYMRLAIAKQYPFFS